MSCAVCSRRQEAADEFARDSGIPRAYGDFTDLCDDGGIDAVYIGTPHGTHVHYAERAIRAGKSVFCEKPLTMTAAEAIELEAPGRGTRGLPDGGNVDEVQPEHAPCDRARRRLERSASRDLSRPVWAYPVPPDGPQRFWVAELGGGALFDMGVYTIALAHLFLGIPDEVRAFGSIRDDGVDLYEGVTLSYSSGGLAQLTTSITFLIPPLGSLGGTEGSIAFGEPLFSPNSLQVAKGRPPDPPTIDRARVSTRRRRLRTDV